MDLGLTDKVAIVTGGSEGIGKAAAQRMAEEGARVVIVARGQEKLDQAALDIRTATEGVVLPLSADVSHPDAAERVVQTALANFGRVDILVNNAGVSLAKPFEEVNDEEWEYDFDLKVWGAVRLMRRSIPEMRKVGGGRIINVTNLGGRTPGPGSMPTSISRATGIAYHQGPFQRPGARQHPGQHRLHRHREERPAYPPLRPPEGEDNPDLTLDEFYAQTAVARGVPLGRIAETEEAGDVITFLASERASYLTGIAINIDGGTSPVV